MNPPLDLDDQDNSYWIVIISFTRFDILIFVKLISVKAKIKYITVINILKMQLEYL